MTGLTSITPTPGLTPIPVSRRAEVAAGGTMKSSKPPATSMRDNGTAGSSVLGSAHQPGPAVFVRLARISDAVVAVGALVGAFLMTNVGRMPQGFGDFLALRITVTNLLLVLA